jgi:hypothetical protein
MPDLAGGEAALARIHARFAKPVRYSMLNHADLPIMAVRQHRPAFSYGGAFMDHQQNVNKLGFEIRKADLPAKPDIDDTISENDGDGPDWAVVEVVDLDEVDAWLCYVDSPDVHQ